MDRGWRARARSLEDGHPAVRAGLPQPVVHAGALDRELRDLLRHPLPERGAPFRPAAANGTDLSDPRRAGRVVRREVRLGATELVRVERRRRRRSAPTRAAGRARIWSPAIGAEALATRQAAGLFDETSFAKLEIVGPGAVAFLQSMCANDVDVPGRADHVHAAAQPPWRHRMRRDRHPGRGRSLPVHHRDRVRAARHVVAAPSPARATAACCSTT